jgi:lysophospholipase L1-like esterase
MEASHVKKSVALLALAALAACGGGGGTTPVLPSNGAGEPPPQQNSLLTRIVGVGDSLTAGYQSDGMLGATTFLNPLYSGQVVPPGQENGWWALLVEQASSGSHSSLEGAINAMYDPAKSPLPLIKGPGLDNQIVFTSSSEPIGQYKGTDSCKYAGGFNQSGFGLRSSARVRMNATATTIRDVGVPGLTLHEANTIHQPQTDTCSPLPGIPGLLSDVVTEESGTYWPVLRNFTRLGGHLTEANAAASLHPTLATVWLGANDVLKYMGSGGRFLGGDRTPGQVEGDLRNTISTLRHAGAKVVMANLPDILYAGYFQRVDPSVVNTRQCKLASYAFCILSGLGGLPQNAVAFFAKKYHLETPNGCVPTSTSSPCGYLTLAGALAVVQAYVANPQAPYVDLDCMQPAPHCKSKPGAGLGFNYITPAFAARIQALNNAVNEGIDDTASGSNVPLVDVQAIFHGLASGDRTNPYFQLASSIAPGLCCTLGYIHPPPPGSGFFQLPGGIFSLDGIHPSNTGYALVAYEFIDTINKAYGTHIPQVDVTAVYNGTRCGNKRYCFPDPYAPH